jgi:hypothetical protein
MTRDEKQILEMFVKYPELVNAELIELNSRIETLPGAYPKTPSPARKLSFYQFARHCHDSHSNFPCR